jgi:cation diffusion facilitator CzcD-associated flavoprotein CzcO
MEVAWDVQRGDVEHLDVLIVGAGLSGIGAARYLQNECPWASFALFEARDAIGGTWDLFRYPGIRSDSDMYTLGYSFRPWAGEETIADGPSILQYIKDTATETGVDEKIRFHHRIVAADWSSAEARWLVTAERVDTGETVPEIVHVTAGFIFSCSGYYRYDRGYEPDFPGKDQFTGKLIHPQHWPDDLDYQDKKIVVIGSGATAVTLIPSLAEKAEHVTMLQRSPSYIATVPAKSPIAKIFRLFLPERLAGKWTRWSLALMTQGFFQLCQRRPKFVKKLLRKGLERQLPEGYDIDTHFTPRYNPWDQRLCAVPNGDLFKAISAGTASVVTDHVDTFTESGIQLQSGGHLDADIIVSATGLELLFIGGINVTVDGADVDVPGRLTYKGMMLEDVPNFALAVGYTNASWTLKCDLTCDYVCRLLNHLHETGLRQCTPTNNDADVVPAPLLGLTSGYITRAQDKFPKQGSKFPWRVTQSYLADWRALKRKSIHDQAMMFSNPEPAGAPELVAVAGS